jgi:hypothetical protein
MINCCRKKPQIVMLQRMYWLVLLVRQVNHWCEKTLHLTTWTGMFARRKTTLPLILSQIYPSLYGCPICDNCRSRLTSTS